MNGKPVGYCWLVGPGILNLPFSTRILILVGVGDWKMPPVPGKGQTAGEIASEAGHHEFSDVLHAHREL